MRKARWYLSREIARLEAQSSPSTSTNASPPNEADAKRQAEADRMLKDALVRGGR